MLSASLSDIAIRNTVRAQHPDVIRRLEALDWDNMEDTLCSISQLESFTFEVRGDALHPKTMQVGVQLVGVIKSKLPWLYGNGVLRIA